MLAVEPAAHRRPDRRASSSAPRARCPAADFAWRNDAGFGRIDPEALPGARRRQVERAHADAHVKLTVFQSDKGDCLLLDAAPAATDVLVDGGMRAAYRAHVAPALGRLARGGRAARPRLRLAHRPGPHRRRPRSCWTTSVAWRVHDFQREPRQHPTHAEPERPRPPAVANIWHNAFHEQVGDNAGRDRGPAGGDARRSSPAREDAGLQEPAPSAPRARRPASARAIELSRAPGPRAARDPAEPAVRRQARARPRRRRGRSAAGRLTISVIGPFARRPRARSARTGTTWLQEQHDEVREPPAQDGAATPSGSAGGDVAALIAPPALAAGEVSATAQQVTAPNLASLMLLVEGGPKHDAPDRRRPRDRHPQGARAPRGSSTRDGRIHVDVLKVQHHGSEHNTRRGVPASA